MAFADNNLAEKLASVATDINQLINLANSYTGSSATTLQEALSALLTDICLGPHE